MIRKSFSSWASGIMFAVTPGKRPRMCGDYRYLNDHTIADAYPIPIIENIVLNLKGASYYTTLDIVRGYNHIEIEERDRYKTAFSTNVGLYEWNRLPFGLKNAPAVFQRVMDIALEEHRLYCRAYFDDVIIFSKAKTEHLQHIEAIYKTFRAMGFKIKKAKCEFVSASVKFCGYIIAEGTIRRDNKFVEAIRRIKRPTNAKELQQFIGLANYGRAFVKNFAEISLPLNKLRKKKIQWQWSEGQETAFQELKRILLTSPKNYLFNPNYKTTLFCDASKHTIAAVLVQTIPSTDKANSSSERIVGFWSKSSPKLRATITYMQRNS